jgi:alkanesulfonate monooxygenase SsuD/methylene tetrahydromethanopterin reductase-like flavin-dependent oxidoreductase (luciferase family)
MTSCGVLLPSFDPFRTGEPSRLLQAARLAEELGFDAAWVGDHLACPAPGLDAVGCLAAAAAVTERISLGFSVMLVGLRPPAWTAKQLITIDALSNGRLVLGVGVGGEFPDEFDAAGVTLRQRGARVDETLAVLPDLLTGRAVHRDGATMRLRVPPLQPAMPAPPRILVGGRGEPALRRAARFGDGWLPMWLTPEAIAQRSRRLHELAAEAGRRTPTVALLIGVHVDDDLQRARREAAGHLDGQYGLALDVVERWTALGSIERVAAHLLAHVEAGVRELVLMPLARDPLSQYERLAELSDHLPALAQGVPSGQTS